MTTTSATDGMTGRVRAKAPGDVDATLDVPGNGVIPGLIDLVGNREHVVTLAHFAGCREHGVYLSLRALQPDVMTMADARAITLPTSTASR